MEPLTTARLEIRPWQSTDLADAATLWGNAKVTALIDSRGQLNPEQVLEKLNKEIHCQETFGVQYWKVVERGSQALVGCAGLRPWAFGESVEREYEIGFHLVPAQWGKGFATEAAKAVIQYAFNELKLPKLYAGHHPQNIASKHLLTKLGFRFICETFYPPTGLNHPSYELINPAKT